MVFQERRVHRLREQVESMMEANRRCDEVRRRQEAFLGHLIEKYQGDNVPLTAELCKQYCALFEVSPSIWRRIYIGSFPASSSGRYPLWSAVTFKFSVISNAAITRPCIEILIFHNCILALSLIHLTPTKRTLIEM